MGIKATLAYRGVSIAGLYFRISNLSFANGSYVGTLSGFKDRFAAISDPLNPAFVLTTTAPYVIGADPFVLLYAAAKLSADLSAITDVLEL
jgi:hypothetical protein